jgi:RNA polymerase sigma-70 factor, ECF subfamily
MTTQQGMESRPAVSSRHERSNDEWLRRLKEGGPSGGQAQRELRDVLVKGLRRGLSGRPEASGLVEDFAQESLLRILANIDQFRHESRFLTWALAIAMRVAFSALRRKQWREVPLDSLGNESSSDGAVALEMPGDSDASGLNPERLLERRDIFALLERAVAESLTERQRTVVLAEIRGMPQEELAFQLGTNRNALYKVCHDARRTLRRTLEEAGFSADVVREAFR